MRYTMFFAFLPLCLMSLSAIGQSSAPVQDSPASTEPPPTITVAATDLAESDPLARSAESAVELEEVIVTSTKRSTTVREIPATINVLEGEALERQGVQSIEQIVAQVPGVNLSDDGAGNAKRVTIRGISSAPSTNFTAGTLFGDIPFSDPFVPKVQLDPNPFDMSTVEVLKGPQGTLFGGTGLNGMIRYVPQAPEFDGVHVKYYTQYNAYPGNGGDGWSYGAAVNTPFADDTAAVRLMGFHREAPGYIDDTQSGKKDINRATQQGVRGALAWEPNEDWKISLLGAWQDYELDDISIADNFDGRLQRGNAPRPSPISTEYTLGNLGIERRFNWGTAISQTSLFNKRYDAFQDISQIALGGTVPLMAGASYNKSKGFSQELRAVSADDGSPWKWLGGVFYYRLNLFDCSEVAVADGLPGLPPSPILDGLIATPCAQNAGRIQGQLNIAHLVGDLLLTEQAVFGEVARALGEDWEVTLGARVYRTESSGTVSTAGLLYSFQNGGMPASRDASSSQEGISPKLSIIYQPVRDLRSYFTVSRGFRFGGPQLGASTPTTQVPETYKSDSLLNYEFGLRSDWFDRTLRIDASAYFIDWTDPQVNQRSADNLAVYIDNVGGVQGKGVDLSLRYLPPFIRGLSLTSGVSWNDTETTAAFDDVSGTTVPSGSPWPNAPHWQTSTTLAYALPLSHWGVNAFVRHTYLGPACNAINCTDKVFDYNTYDVNVSAFSLDHPLWPELSLSVENLTDERAINASSTTSVAGSDVNVINYIAPRAVIVRLSGRF